MGEIPHDAYERARRDATFREAVRDAHAGGWDVLDSLWWRTHPLDAAPSGTPSPAARLDELKRTLFAPDGGAGGNADATRDLNDLTAELASERAAIESALRAVAAAERGASRRVPAAQEETLSLGTTSLGEITGVAADPPRMLRSGFLLLSAAVLLGAIVGWQVHAGAADAAAPVTVRPPATPSPRPSPPPAAALAIFDRPQQQSDIPAGTLPADFEMGTFRALGTHFQGMGQTVTTVYAAKSNSGLVCMVALSTADDYLATCALAPQFPAIGLRLYWPIEVQSQSEDGVVRTVVMDTVSTWKPDGALEGGGLGQRDR